MEKVQAMTEAMCDAATEYGAKHGLNAGELLNALAHTYVIYGFSAKKENVNPQVLKDELVKCVAESCDRMIEVSADE